MHLSIELELLLLALGLYLLDCLLLLAPGEGLLIARKGHHWQLMLGSRHARFRGRTLVCLPLFSLHRPVFRVDWIDGMDDAPGAKPGVAGRTDPLAARRLATRPLLPLVYGIATAQFVLFPLMLFVLRTPLMVAVTLALLYGQVLLAMGWLVRHREHLQITRRASLSLALECLLCPPVALNLLRRLSLSTPDPSKPTVLLPALHDSSDWPIARERMMEDLAELLDAEDPGSHRYRQLNERRATLAGMESS